MGNVILVEVKPISEIDEDVCSKMVEADNGEHELLLVGLKPLAEANAFSSPAVGWMTECRHNYFYGNPGDPWGSDWGCAVFNANERYGFFHEHNSYHDRMTGNGDGDHHIRTPTWEQIELLWNQAANKAQWIKGGESEGK